MSAGKAGSNKAGANKTSTGKTGGGKFRKREIPQHNKNQLYMKLVTSDTCKVCKSQCARGIDYMERMERTGAVGNGVPCILTGYKINT